MALTRGVINDIICSDPKSLPVNPIVQVLAIKKLGSWEEVGNPIRIRLAISDGVHCLGTAMLGTLNNDKVRKGMIEKKAFIRLTRYVCNTVNEKYRVLIILDLEIVQKASKVKGRIGRPLNMSHLVADHKNLKFGVLPDTNASQSSSNRWTDSSGASSDSDSDPKERLSKPLMTSNLVAYHNNLKSGILAKTNAAKSSSSRWIDSSNDSSDSDSSNDPTSNSDSDSNSESDQPPTKKNSNQVCKQNDSMSLTRGVIKEILNSPEPENLPTNPVIQVVGVKKLPASGPYEQQRFRLAISDGTHYYSSAMLGTPMNHKVGAGMIELNAVIRLTQYTCNIIQKRRCIVIILDLDIVAKASETSGKIGEPEKMGDLIANHADLKSGVLTGTKSASSSYKKRLRSNNSTTNDRPSPYARNKTNQMTRQKHDISLTSGVISEIICTEDLENLPANPVVQVLKVLKLPKTSGSNTDPDRFRLALSDGVHYYLSAMLGFGMTDKVGDGMIEVNSVICVTNYTCNIIEGTRLIIAILDLEVVGKASEMSGKIGEPEKISDLVADHANLMSGNKTT